MIRVSEASFDPGAELAAFDRATKGAGAIVSFLGKVRGYAEDEEVDALYLEHYAGVTEQSIAEIEETAKKRWNISEALIIHRVGRLAPGEPIVMVCVSSKHRRDAFEAADFLMDYLKTQAMFWKKEIRNESEAWIEPRKEDYKDVARWREEN